MKNTKVSKETNKNEKLETNLIVVSQTENSIYVKNIVKLTDKKIYNLENSYVIMYNNGELTLEQLCNFFKNSITELQPENYNSLSNVKNEIDNNYTKFLTKDETKLYDVITNTKEIKVENFDVETLVKRSIEFVNKKDIDKFFTLDENNTLIIHTKEFINSSYYNNNFRNSTKIQYIITQNINFEKNDLISKFYTKNSNKTFKLHNFFSLDFKFNYIETLRRLELFFYNVLNNLKNETDKLTLMRSFIIELDKTVYNEMTIDKKTNKQTKIDVNKSSSRKIIKDYFLNRVCEKINKMTDNEVKTYYEKSLFENLDDFCLREFNIKNLFSTIVEISKKECKLF